MLPLELRTADSLTGPCSNLGGPARPCLTDCPRKRYGVDEWEPEVEEVISMYFRMMGWSMPGMATHPGLMAMARRDLRLMLEGESVERERELLYLAQRFHLEVVKQSEASSGATA